MHHAIFFLFQSSGWDSSQANLDRCFRRKEGHAPSDHSHIPIVPNQGIPFSIPDGLCTINCQYGPQRHQKRDERLAAARDLALRVSQFKNLYVLVVINLCGMSTSRNNVYLCRVITLKLKRLVSELSRAKRRAVRLSSR